MLSGFSTPPPRGSEIKKLSSIFCRDWRFSRLINLSISSLDVVVSSERCFLSRVSRLSALPQDLAFCLSFQSRLLILSFAFAALDSLLTTSPRARFRLAGDDFI